ncbi:hypothetical protein ASF61_08900 [Duganella sp. Leaf126]|uniref:hypothetical protein n=1 Tax=Duganella sp. Leaf126 TaxID=1736266 RepID=UPI0006F98B87|nr:hypothetical protein [Duganella sp. Leaf126]KQQ36286.1 hypothetical protein ASF61_08900 [Duganella sp. Leaf126]
MPTSFDPFWLFKMPFSGDVMPRINSPWFSPTFNFAGDARVEDRVVSEVASYGRQIGWLNDLVVKLVQGEQPDPDVLAKVTAAMQEIEQIKQAQASSLLRAAVEALDQLAAREPALYRQLLQRREGSAGA